MYLQYTCECKGSTVQVQYAPATGELGGGGGGGSAFVLPCLFPGRNAPKNASSARGFSANWGFGLAQRKYF